MKRVIQAILLALFFFVGIPLILGTFLSGTDEKEVKNKGENLNKVGVPKTINVWIAEEEKVEKMDFEDYVTGVTASEMPSSFDEEALKAQSVAARTYAMAKVLKYDEKKPDTHPEAPVCNTTHCQAYKSKKRLIELHDDGWEKNGFNKVKKACEATEGELLYYDGEMVMQPLFFSSSGGQTENSEDVFSGAYPYLVSVSSPYEENASHKNEEKSFSFGEIKSLLNNKYPDRAIGQLSSANIKIISRTSGGRVDKMQVGQSSFKGTEIRNALGLSSALFSVGFGNDGKSVTFTSNGFGHGVGLSQYGADGMAKEGNDYKEILTHYYTGTKIY